MSFQTLLSEVIDVEEGRLTSPDPVVGEKKNVAIARVPREDELQQLKVGVLPLAQLKLSMLAFFSRNSSCVFSLNEF